MTKTKRGRKAGPRAPEKTNMFFLDSGAHSLYTQEVIKKGHKEGYAYYETREFWEYVDRYCNFIKANQHGIDYYANVDAIFNPELSWRILKYMETEHKLQPVPVIHYNTPLKWIKKHLKEGYEYIGLGGLGQEVMKQQYFAWADQVYELLCPASNNRLPIVRTHGFAMTSWELLTRYPWWSVDSASWAKAGGFGVVYVPRPHRGTYSFDKQPFNIGMSNDSPAQKNRGRHLFSISQGERLYVYGWLEKIGVPVGKVDADGEMLEWGVVSHHAARKIANLKYYQALAASLPEWPWAFKTQTMKGFF